MRNFTVLAIGFIAAVVVAAPIQDVKSKKHIRNQAVLPVSHANLLTDSPASGKLSTIIPFYADLESGTTSEEKRDLSSVHSTGPAHSKSF